MSWNWGELVVLTFLAALFGAAMIADMNEHRGSVDDQPMRGALSAGGPHEPPMRASYSMRSSRPSMTGNRRIAAGSCITATEAANTSRSSIPSASRRQASSRRSAASAIATTMPSPKRSMASTRPRSSIGADHGGP